MHVDNLYLLHTGVRVSALDDHLTQRSLRILRLFHRLGKYLELAASLVRTSERATFLCDQGMRAAKLDDRAFIQNQDLVIVDDGLQTMCDGDDCVLD